MKITTRQTTFRLQLEAATVMTLTSDAGEPVPITCVSGVLWVTVDGEGRDVILRPGDYAEIPAGGRAVVQALRPSVLGSVPCRLAG